ncbi:hypothetical protein LUZ61_009241 [Rhynchospora tenuis]|uniref:Uncharacterized protein n=1 Tax=Rhynchospora tenuis TaxID=198213 RepID=A0AAD6EY42_9POAL|nr:hypothetical protein LUZ61_009241 [Rhynchospora tenuis]
MNDVASSVGYSAGSGTNENVSTLSNEDENIDTVNQPEVRYPGWKSMPFVIGTASNCVFHMSNAHEATTLNVFNGATNLATVVGAYISDSYLGHYATVWLVTLASLLASLLRTIHNVPPAMTATLLQVSNFQSLGLPFHSLLAGAGGIRPCNIAFSADQFNPNTDLGRKGIASFFNCLIVDVVRVFVVAFKKRILSLPGDQARELFQARHASSIVPKLSYTEQFKWVFRILMAAIIFSESDILPNGTGKDPWMLCGILSYELFQSGARSSSITCYLHKSPPI